MRLALFAALLVLELAACKHKGQAHTSSGDTTIAVSPDVFDTKPVAALSDLKMSDPQAEPQLVHGFYRVESGSWRWTASKFAVILRWPEGSAQQGALLEFKFSLPEVIVNKFGPVTLSAKINGTALHSQTYSKPGDYIYASPIAAEAPSTGQANLEFSTDKAMPPSNADKRELALVAVSVALLKK
jgi:hypothetical protein